MLQSVEEKYGKDGVVLLPVSTDSPETRSKVPEYIRKHNLRARVFQAEQDEVPFPMRFVGSLFLIDRKGFVAGVPSEFFASDLRETLEKKIPDLVAGKPAPGPLLLELDKAPPGFGILWQRPLDFRVVKLAIAPASAGGEAEIGVLGEQKLARYTPTGEFKDQVSVSSRKVSVRSFSGVDLEGKGSHEWVVGYPANSQVLAPDGEILDGFYGPRLRILGFRDLDGDGVKEILCRDDGGVVAKRALPGLLWRSEGIQDFRAAQIDPAGAILVQRAEKVCVMDREGRLGPPCYRAPEGEGLIGSLGTREGRSLDAFGTVLEENLDLKHDLDGDGTPEIVLAREGGILGYGVDGSLRLLARVVESLEPVQFAAGDLDGRPGDELILAIPSFGLVALGRNPPAPDRSARNDSDRTREPSHGQ